MVLATATGVQETVRAVESHFSRIFTELAQWHDALSELFAAGPVTAAMASAALMARAITFLDGPHHVVGGGFVASRDALADQSLYLAWWQGEHRQLLAEPALNAATPLAYDYTRRPWFSNPERTGRPTLTGPYVDFVCTDEYTVTATVPVRAAGRMVGVVGADTLVETLERVLLPGLRTVGATLVNEHGRAVVSADPHIGPGDRVTGHPHPIGDLPLTLVFPV
ncbi:cache domain-containing protein [Nocardioides sp.]|uniref:cache domain-containing protein n=1 Tax=Nocardioides sp. TaxID=35761 RepID=UPI00260E80D4|nr:cache domain-containing protein [Nocardioides sp.]